MSRLHVAPVRHDRIPGKWAGDVVDLSRRAGRYGADPFSTDLSLMCGRRLLVLLDAQNVSISLRRNRRDCDYAKLLQAMRSTAASVSAHAFAWVEPGEAEDYARRYFEEGGWTSHIQPFTRVVAHDGVRHRANCDGALLVWAGCLISRSRADMLVMISGDGDLVEDVLNFVKELPARRTAVVMGVTGCISSRLRAGQHPAIAAVIELGRDMMATL